MDQPGRHCHDEATPRGASEPAGKPEHAVMNIPHGPIDLLLAAALSLLIAAFAIGSALA